jgi:hypothetical protein
MRLGTRGIIQRQRARLARLAFPRKRRGAREEGRGKGEKEEEGRDEVAA